MKMPITPIARCFAALLLLLALLVSDLWAADIYECVVDGVATYSDKPCDEKGGGIIRTPDGFELRATGRSHFRDWSEGVIHSIGEFLGRSWHLLLIIVALVIVILRMPRVKEALGEVAVNLLAKTMLNDKDYHLFRNVTLPGKDGIMRIDHVIVSPYGIFVIEMKHKRGWIFGSPDHQAWTQQIHKHTSTFQNPLHQNEQHLQALADLLHISRMKMYSVVAFVGASTFKTPMPENVTEGRGWIRFIKSRKRPLLSAEEVARIRRDIAALLRLTP